MNRSEITAEIIRRLFSYDPSTGEFTNNPRSSADFASDGHTSAHNCAAWNARRAGKRAGTIGKGGYRYISLYGLKFAEHRLAWLYMTGKTPDMEIDHIDRNRFNNSWPNLRQASSSENKWNCAKRSKNKSGFKGVSFFKPAKKYRAEIKHNYKNIHLGYFSTPDEAHRAYCSAAARLHGEFANT